MERAIAIAARHKEEAKLPRKRRKKVFDFQLVTIARAWGHFFLSTFGEVYVSACKRNLIFHHFFSVNFTYRD